MFSSDQLVFRSRELIHGCSKIHGASFRKPQKPRGMGNQIPSDYILPALPKQAQPSSSFSLVSSSPDVARHPRKSCPDYTTYQKAG